MGTSQRLISLDVLRGITISIMVLVNTPGSWSYIYAPLRHAAWHGCTPTDLVFPFFLFIVGLSLFFSFKKYNAVASKAATFKIFKRTMIIFLIGLLLNLYPYFNFEGVRIMGVLQRIALAYGAGALLCVNFKRPKLVIIAALLLLGYWALLYFGGNANPYSLEGNMVRQFDLFLFGEQHVYKGFGIPFDPEGVLSSIPAVATVIIGYLIGELMDSTTSIIALKMKKLLLYGAVMTIMGYLWGLVFPINKPLWTSSYVLYTAGLATLLLALLIFIIDYKKFSAWSKPFVHFGSNPLFIFVFSGVYAKTISYLIKIPISDTESVSLYRYLFAEVFAPLFGNMNGSLAFAISHIIVFWLICYILYRNKIFIKI